MKSFFIRNKKIVRYIAIVLAVVTLLLGVFTVYDNFHLDVEFFSISSSELPDDFGRFKIAHISDYHNRSSSIVNNSIIDSLKEEKPDIIVFTGDAVDSRKPDFQQSLYFMDALQNIAQVYFVTGNHEYNLSLSHSEEYISFISSVEEIGVIILHNESVKVEVSDGEYINLYGIQDPYFTGHPAWEIDIATEDLCSALNIEEGYNILLAHHPEQMGIYADYGFDLVLSGHAHGGQVTFFGVPLMAPDQEGLPEYSEGVYVEGSTKMILSRGIGYSVIPFRFFCPPNLIYVEFNS